MNKKELEKAKASLTKLEQDLHRQVEDGGALTLNGTYFPSYLRYLADQAEEIDRLRDSIYEQSPEYKAIMKMPDMEETLNNLAGSFCDEFNDGPLDHDWFWKVYSKRVNDRFRELLSYNDFQGLMMRKIKKLSQHVFERLCEE